MVSSLKDLLIEDEGLRFDLYDDHNGHTIRQGSVVIGNPTIGIGHRLGTLPQQVVDLLYQLDVAAAVKACRDAIGPAYDVLDDVRQAALCSMAFNLGEPRFDDFHKMIAAILAQDWGRASAEALDSDAARENPNRWQRDAAMLRSGQWPE